MASKTQRIDIRVPLSLLEKIEGYQEQEDITSRTAALLELVRIGLKAEESKK